MKENQNENLNAAQSTPPAENAGMVYGNGAVNSEQNLQPNAQAGAQLGAQAGLQSGAQEGLQSSMQTGAQTAQQHVVAVRKNGDGDIVELKLSSGQVVDYKTAQMMAKNEQIAHVQVFRGRDNEEHLRSTPDGRKDNNLDNLPTF